MCGICGDEKYIDILQQPAVYNKNISLAYHAANYNHLVISQVIQLYTVLLNYFS